MSGVYVVIGERARKAELAKSGQDLGAVIRLDLSEESEEIRVGLAACAEEARRRQAGLPEGALVIYAEGSADATPTAILAACEEEEAEEVEEVARQKREEARKADREKAAGLKREKRVEEAREAPVGGLVGRRYHGGPWEPQHRTILADAGRLEGAEEEAERRNGEEEGAKAKKKAEHEREIAVALADRAAWVLSHGSPRLRRLLKEEIECGAVYSDERLASDRPGWRWDRDVCGDSRVARNASEEALALLDEARASLPEHVRAEARLAYWVVDPCDGASCPGHADECSGYHEGWRGYAVTAEFLGHEILYGGPSPE